ncbi:MAG: hypothetical protein AAF965_13100 [Pseudomonadota bacterium]
MSTFLPNDVLEGLEDARRRGWHSSRRLRIEAGSQRLAVTRAWEGGFALHAQTDPNLRGLVDLYDGSRHLKRCLIVASERDGEEMRYELKVVNEATDQQPVDFERASDAPVALIAKT